MGDERVMGMALSVYRLGFVLARWWWLRGFDFEPSGDHQAVSEGHRLLQSRCGAEAAASTAGRATAT